MDWNLSFTDGFFPFFVSLYMSEWIEIQLIYVSYKQILVSLYMSEWIEMLID